MFRKAYRGTVRKRGKVEYKQYTGPKLRLCENWFVCRINDWKCYHQVWHSTMQSCDKPPLKAILDGKFTDRDARVCKSTLCKKYTAKEKKEIKNGQKGDHKKGNTCPM